jgi:hypothetical protein
MLRASRAGTFIASAAPVQPTSLPRQATVRTRTSTPPALHELMDDTSVLSPDSVKYCRVGSDKDGGVSGCQRAHKRPGHRCHCDVCGYGHELIDATSVLTPTDSVMYCGVGCVLKKNTFCKKLILFYFMCVWRTDHG